MAFSTAAKVGVVTVASIIAASAGFAWLTNFSFGDRGYTFRVVYQDVAGLLDGASVMYMGVKVGQVESIVPQERHVEVRVRVFKSDMRLLDTARFMIMSQGIIGEKSLEIFPPSRPPLEPDYIEPGEAVRGNDPQRFELVMEEFTKTFDEFQKSLDPDLLQETFQQTASNLVATTESVKRLSAQTETLLAAAGGTLEHIDRLLIDTDRLVLAAKPAEVEATVADIRKLSAGLLVTYERFFGSQEAQAEQDTAMRNIFQLSRELEQLASTLNRTAGDPKVQADLRDTIKNIRELTGAVRGATNLPETAAQVGGVTVRPRIQGVAAHTPTGTGLAGNLALKGNIGENYLFGGIEQIGEGNYLNLYFGDDASWGPAGFHAGLIRSKIGVGIDYDLLPSFRLTGQLYDPFRPTFRLGSTYFPLSGSQYGLMAQWARTFQTNENFIWLGVEWRPLD